MNEHRIHQIFQISVLLKGAHAIVRNRPGSPPVERTRFNAGGSAAQDDTAVSAPFDEFWRAIRLGLYGTFLGCRFGIPELIGIGGGAVINMSSNVMLMDAAGRDCSTADAVSAAVRNLLSSYILSMG